MDCHKEVVERFMRTTAGSSQAVLIVLERKSHTFYERQSGKHWQESVKSSFDKYALKAAFHMLSEKGRGLCTLLLKEDYIF